MLKNGRLQLKNGTMDYAAFGSGERTLVILPGLGDSLRSVRGTALPFSLLYRTLGKDFQIYMCSRIRPLASGCTTRDFARDQKEAMDLLGIQKADVLGVSQGGMIAQWLAIDYPEAVNKLVLTVTCPRPNPVLNECITGWMELAREGKDTEFMRDNLNRIYSPGYVARYGWAAPIAGRLTLPKSRERFLTMAQACLTHDAYDLLPNITAPTLILGGGEDQVLTAEASQEIAARIPQSQLILYPHQGHGLYEEAEDFQQVVSAFLLKP